MPVALQRERVSRPAFAERSQLPKNPERAIRANSQPATKPALSNNQESIARLAKDIVCSATRALGRQLESSVELISDNPIVRVPFRFLTEIIRNGTSGSVQSVLENKKVSSKIWFDGAKKGLENAVATAIFEPNKYTNTIARVGSGFANMLVRFAARLALVALEVISPNDIGLEEMPDDLAVRSLGRIVKPFSDSPFVGVGTRFLEQMLINRVKERKIISSHILPAVKQKISEK